MTNSSSDDRPGEFELIAKLFAPLSAHAPGAYGLTDDAAAFHPAAGEDVVVTADLLSEGVHFRGDDPPALIAKKALRVNLSDLAAKGAVAQGYLLSLALPQDWTTSWMESFARGLAEDQEQFSVSLWGGDTTATRAALTIAITAFGTVPAGTMVRRNGAKPGDRVFVSGTIGDGGGGLDVLSGKRIQGSPAERNALAERYQLPTPRLALGRALRGVATAMLDISDGLLADLGHIADTSRVGIAVDAALVPLSGAYRSVIGHDEKAVLGAVTAGDDYELAFTAPEAARGAVAQAAAATGTAVTEIGSAIAGRGVTLLGGDGREIPAPRKGYRHF
ncbi:MAG: thiamine-phosphate kinase [Rhizomicrobium sp.]